MAYDADIIDVGEINKRIIFIDSIGARDVFGVCWKVAFLVII
jgi:hypothetical protein